MDQKAIILEAARLNAVNVGDKRASTQEENQKCATDLVGRNLSPKKANSRHAAKVAEEKTQSSRTPERSKKFLPIADKPLIILRTSAPTFDRFSFSPLSPKAFPRFNSSEWDTLPGRSSLLERYLETQEGHSPILRQSSEPIPHIQRPSSDPIAPVRVRTLAGTGVGGSVSTAPLPQREFTHPTSYTNRGLVERSRNNSVASSSHTRSSTSTSKSQSEHSTSRIRHGNPPSARSCTSSSTTSRSSHQRIGKLRSSSQSRVVSARSWESRESNERSNSQSTNLSKLRVETPTMVLPFDQIVLSPSLAKECGLPSPPPAPTVGAFGENIPALTVSIGSSPFDPPPAPVRDSFPLVFPASPSFSGPAPIDTTLEVEEAPVILDERFRAIEGGRFQTVDTPINPPPAPMRDSFPLQFPPSPKRAGPCPIDTSAVYVTSPSSTWDDLSPSGSITPTQPPSACIEELIPAPLLAASKTVRFADLTLSTQSRTSDGQSPPVFSPVTPIAMMHAFPFITPASPLMQESPRNFEEASHQDLKPIHQNQDSEVVSIYKSKARDLSPVPRGRGTDRIPDQKPRARTLSPPRTAISLNHDPWATLPTTVYEPNSSDTNGKTPTTGHGSSFFPGSNSHTRSESTESDRNHIMQAYFQQARASVC